VIGNEKLLPYSGSKEGDFASAQDDDFGFQNYILCFAVWKLLQ